MDEFRQRVISYQIAMAIARNMLSQGIIAEEEYRKIDTIMAEKYGISLGSIFRE